jgi:hypothetical protein
MILDLNLGDYRNYNTVVSNLIPSYWWFHMFELLEDGRIKFKCRNETVIVENLHIAILIKRKC